MSRDGNINDPFYGVDIAYLGLGFYIGPSSLGFPHVLWMNLGT